MHKARLLPSPPSAPLCRSYIPPFHSAAWAQTSYQLGEADYGGGDAGGSWVARLAAGLELTTGWLVPLLAPGVWESLLLLLLDKLLTRLEVLLGRKVRACRACAWCVVDVHVVGLLLARLKCCWAATQAAIQFACCTLSTAPASRGAADAGSAVLSPLLLAAAPWPPARPPGVQPAGRPAARPRRAQPGGGCRRHDQPPRARQVCAAHAGEGQRCSAVGASARAGCLRALQPGAACFAGNAAHARNTLSRPAYADSSSTCKRIVRHHSCQMHHCTAAC